MSSTFVFLFLCLGSFFIVMGAYHRTPRGFVRSNVLNRPSQCVSKNESFVGECTILGGKNYGVYLKEDSCKILICIRIIEGQHVCVESGPPAEKTPCGLHSVCRNGTCVLNKNSG